MCYVGPTIAAVVTTIAWKKNRSQKMWWLNLMFYGGAIFGIIDHLWNGELFLISTDWMKDTVLGVIITLGTVVAWKAITVMMEKNISLSPEQSVLK